MPLQVFFTFACALKARHADRIVTQTRLKSAHMLPLSLHCHFNSRHSFIQEKNKTKQANQPQEICETCALTPVLRSGYPPCAAVSLVVLSPTREGRVCDIQLVIIAMVLSTTPIFSKGTDIFARCLDFCSSRLHSTDSGEKQGRRVMLPSAACCFTRDSGSAGLFLDISNEAPAANESDALKNDRSGRLKKKKLQHLIQRKIEERNDRERLLGTSSG